MIAARLEDTVARHPLFCDLSDDQLGAILALARPVSFTPRHYIFHQREPARQFYIITAGRVSLETSDPARGVVVIQTLSAGDVLGWSWVVKPYVWHFDARAVVATDLVAFDGQRLRELFERETDLGYRMVTRFMEVLLQRLQATRLQLMDVYGDAHSRY